MVVTCTLFSGRTHPKLVIENRALAREKAEFWSARLLRTLACLSSSCRIGVQPFEDIALWS